MAKQKTIDKATDLELAQALNEAYSQLMTAQSQLALINQELNQRQQKKKEK